jgi:hypothetical protein
MNTVQQIYDQLVTVSQDKLGVNWQRLRKIYDPAQNDFRNIEQAFAVRHQAASSDADATQVYVLTQLFEVLLADRAANRDSDLAIQDRLNVLYDKADEIFKEAVRTKLSLEFVTQVSGLQFREPVLLENGAILLTAGLDVKYYVDPY